MAPDQARGGESASRRRRSRTTPGRIILAWIVAYALALAALALTGYDEALPALWLPVGALIGYSLGYLASRSPGRPGEIRAYLFLIPGLGALMIMAVFIVAAIVAEASDPWWLASLGFVSGVVAATYIRLKYPPQR